MIPMVLALIAFLPADPAVLSPGQACTVANMAQAPERKTYVIAGTYHADGHHGSFMELPTCDATLFPIMTGQAEARIDAYHQAFQQKCGGPLMGDYIDGIFTGTFSRRRAQLYGMQSAMRISFFVVSGIDTKSLDPASITCPR